MAGLALVVGASGIVGNNLARHLRARGWPVYGLRGGPPPTLTACCRYRRIPARPRHAWPRAERRGPTHVFITTWLRQESEAENIRVNAAMVRNLLDALPPAGAATSRW